MLPLLDRGEAATHRAVRALTHQGGGHGGCVVGVLGAIFVAGQVMAGHVAEGFVHLHQAQRRGQCRFDGVAAVEQLTTIFTVQPAPERVLGRRIVDTDASQCRESAQAFDLPVQRLDQGFTEADHHRFAVHQALQVIERGR
ncbi:hypothetical protein D9M73_224430 [compost metagenome]